MHFRGMRTVEEILPILLDIGYTAVQVTCRKSMPAVQIQENDYMDEQMNKAFGKDPDIFSQQEKDFERH